MSDAGDAASGARAQELSCPQPHPAVVEDSVWRGKPAWRVTRPGASDLCVVVSSVGGHLCAITAAGSDVNPLWQPEWAPGDPADASSNDTWGEGPEAALLTSICGSNLCCDRFGAPHPGEERPLHGEVGVTRFAPASAQADGAFAVEAVLPLAGLRVTRLFRLADHAVTLTTVVRPLAPPAAPRYVEWAEHTTLGGSFLDGCAVAARVDTCTAMPDDAAAAADAPLASVDIAAALAVPGADDPPVGHVRTCRVVDGAWSATNARLGWRLSAVFDAAEFPWLVLWTEHRLRTHNPWRGVQRARGMELSTKPFPEGKPPPSREREFQGRPAAMHVGADGARKTVTLTWERC